MEDFDKMAFEDIDSQEPIDEEVETIVADEPETSNEIVEPQEPIIQDDKTKQAAAYQKIQSERDALEKSLEKERAENQRKLEEYNNRLSKLETPPEEVVELKAPERPIKPRNYDAIDAVSDSDTDSFKWRVANEDWQAEMTEYYIKRDEARETAFQKDQESKSQKEQSARYADTTLAGYKAQGVDDPTAKRYFERLHFKDESRSAEFAVVANKAWEEHIAKPGRPASKPKLESPLPPGVDGAITEQTTIKTVDDAFDEGLKDPADGREL